MSCEAGDLVWQSRVGPIEHYRTYYLRLVIYRK
jgi:hypothetical protein